MFESAQSVLLIERDALLRRKSQSPRSIDKRLIRDRPERLTARSRSPLTRNSTNPILPSFMLALGPRVDMGIMNWKETRPCASVRIDCDFAEGRHHQNPDECTRKWSKPRAT